MHVCVRASTHTVSPATVGLSQPTLTPMCRCLRNKAGFPSPRQRREIPPSTNPDPVLSATGRSRAWPGSPDCKIGTFHACAPQTLFSPICVCPHSLSSTSRHCLRIICLRRRRRRIKELLDFHPYLMRAVRILITMILALHVFACILWRLKSEVSCLPSQT